MADAVFVTGGSGYLGRNLLRALVARGVQVRALARSEASARVVEELGARSVRGDLLDEQVMRLGMEGCGAVYHCAAFVEDWDPDGQAWSLNVDGTRSVLRAARDAGVGVVVHVSTEAVLVGGPPIVDADESWPLPQRPIGPYPITKGAAECVVREAADAGQRAVIVRPRFIWGNDDSTLLPRLVEAVEQGVLRWFDGGRYLTSTCHVDNVVHGMMLAAELGRPGEAYFLTDGQPVEFREFVSAMLRARALKPPTGTLPFKVIYALAWGAEWLWSLPIPGRPPITRMGVLIVGRQCTVSDRKARDELGYAPVTSVRDGLRDLAARAEASRP